MLHGVAGLRFQLNLDAVRDRSRGELAASLLEAEERIAAAEQARLAAERARLAAEQAHAQLVADFAEVTADRDALARAKEVLWKEKKARDNEVEVLYKRIAELVEQLSQTTQKDLQEHFALEIGVLQRRLDDRNQTLYGTSSERRDHPAAEGPQGLVGEPVNRPRKPKRSGSKRTFQSKLPIVAVPHTLSPESQAGGCGACHGDLQEMKGQTEDHEEITVKRVVYQVNLHQCQKYRCIECGWIGTAPGPAKLISGGRYAPEFAVHSAVSKFVDHMPLERQVKQMGRAGLEVTSQALWDQHRTTRLAVGAAPAPHAPWHCTR